MESAVKQSYKNIEILVIDDGSQDNTKGIVEPYVKGGMAKYFWQANKGVSAARNKGIIESSADFIAFLDSDDLWMPNHLTQLKEALHKFKDVHIAFSSFKFIGQNADEEFHNDAFGRAIKRFLQIGLSEQESGIWLSNINLLKALFEVGLPFRIQGSMCNREFLLNHKLLFDEGISYTEEAQLVTEAAVYTKFIFVDRIGLLVRRHSENLGDECYQQKKIISYEQRVKRMKKCFRGKLVRAERRAFNHALWRMQSYVTMERGKNANIVKKISEGIRLIGEVPTYESFKSVIKMFLRK